MITTPKTKKSNRMIKMPKFLCEEMQEYLSILYGLKKKAHINEQTYMTVTEIVNADTLYPCGICPSVHLVMEITFCDCKDTVFLL